MKETKWMLLGCALDNKSAAAFCEFLTACQRDEESKVENGAFTCREFEYLEYVCGKRKIRWKSFFLLDSLSKRNAEEFGNKKKL
ncbi:hypothetical protein OUZ56_021903 [Daphnia magna]|uniref:Uncharacterized protein n=1 Tax=Daphnia magna TaxID=35525 RepID=A0ABR0AUS4_9CRUS|nr:hypothetical protein OUZ56_021903 [Daphnia magna]